MTDFRALCAELINELHCYKNAHPQHDTDLIDRARAALAQPEPEGPTPLNFSHRKPGEQFIRMDEGRIQRSTGNNPTTPKPKIIPKGQVSGSGVMRVNGTFEHGGRTYSYEADAKPTRDHL
jgi:hypothetical protein